MSVFGEIQPRTLSKSASSHLDMIRGLAALAVMWGHLRGLFFVDLRRVRHPSLAVSALYFLTGFGHQAVMVFFVLSGFLISSAIISRRVSGSWSWSDYAIDRSTRLYVVLIPALLLGLLWDKLGASLFAQKHVYSQPIAGFGTAIAQSHLTVGTFFGNLFFLQTITCSTFGSNGPLWSLANEFWYYVLFPIGLAAIAGWLRRDFTRALPMTLLTVCVAMFLGPRLLLGFLVWLCGTSLVLVYAKSDFLTRGWRFPYVVFSAALLVVCLTAARTGKLPLLGNDVVVGAVFSLFLLAAIRVDFDGGTGPYSRAAHTLAGFSYSLYVLHFPFLLFFRAWLIGRQRWQPNLSHLGYGAFLGAAALVFAWLTASITEKNTHAVRHWIKALKKHSSLRAVETSQAGK